MANRDIGLQEVLTSSFDYLTSDLHTSIPGIVLTVRENFKYMTVDVQPSINIRSEDGGDISERPPILNVPVCQPLSKNAGLTFPINVGDPVLLVFSMRGLDVWKRGNGYPATPSDLRKFNIRDCIAIPGIFPSNISPNNSSTRVLPHDPQDVVLAHNIGKPSEVEIRITKSGEVRIRAAQGNIYLDSHVRATKGMTITDGLEVDGIVFGTHRHGGVEPGGSNTDIPTN